MTLSTSTLTLLSMTLLLEHTGSTINAPSDRPSTCFNSFHTSPVVPIKVQRQRQCIVEPKDLPTPSHPGKPWSETDPCQKRLFHMTCGSLIQYPPRAQGHVAEEQQEQDDQVFCGVFQFQNLTSASSAVVVCRSNHDVGCMIFRSGGMPA